MQWPYDRSPVASNHQATTHFRKLEETQFSNNTLVREHATGSNWILEPNSQLLWILAKIVSRLLPSQMHFLTIGFRRDLV